MVAAIEIWPTMRRGPSRVGQREAGAERPGRKARLSRLGPDERHRAQAPPSGKLTMSSIAGRPARGQRATGAAQQPRRHLEGCVFGVDAAVGERLRLPRGESLRSRWRYVGRPSRALSRRLGVFQAAEKEPERART